MFRTLLVKRSSKIQYMQGYMIIYDGEEERKIFLKEISTIILESNQILLTTPFLIQCVKNNINLIFCDEQHNPIGSVLGLKNNFNTSGNITKQIKWTKKRKDELWQKIIIQKIKMQSYVLSLVENSRAEEVKSFINSVELADKTNREAIAAKMYFNSLFGKDFSRSEQFVVNDHLDYGYAIILSCFNREIVGFGYLTQLGVFHIGSTNPFNLSCDFMEPFRPIVDIVSYLNFEKNVIRILRKVLTKRIYINEEKRYVDDAIKIFTNQCIKYLNEELNEIPEISFLSKEEYEDKGDENNSNV